MELVESIAQKLDISPRTLLHESLRTYLEQQLMKIESQIYQIAKKHDVAGIFDLDKKIKEGLVREEDSYEDFFALDHLVSEREKIQEILGIL